MIKEITSQHVKSIGQTNAREHPKRFIDRYFSSLFNLSLVKKEKEDVSFITSQSKKRKEEIKVKI